MQSKQRGRPMSVEAARAFLGQIEFSCRRRNAIISLCHLQTAFGVPQNKLDLLPSNTGKPFEEFIDPRAAFEVFEQRPDRDSGRFEYPLAADFIRRAFHC